MTLPTPQNSEEAGYLALATVRELLNLLISKSIIDDGDIAAMIGLVSERLEKEPNSSSQRVARVLTERMDGKD